MNCKICNKKAEKGIDTCTKPFCRLVAHYGVWSNKCWSLTKQGQQVLSEVLGGKRVINKKSTTKYIPRPKRVKKQAPEGYALCPQKVNKKLCNTLIKMTDKTCWHCKFKRHNPRIAFSGKKG